MKIELTQKEINTLLCGLNVLAENAQKAAELIYDNDIIDELDRYVEELGNLNLKLCGRGESA